MMEILKVSANISIRNLSFSRLVLKRLHFVVIVLVEDLMKSEEKDGLSSSLNCCLTQVGNTEGVMLYW